MQFMYGGTNLTSKEKFEKKDTKQNEVYNSRWSCKILFSTFYLD